MHERSLLIRTQHTDKSHENLRQDWEKPTRSVRKDAGPTGDNAIAMNYGPVLSHTYNLVKGRENSPQDWDKHIRSVSKKVVLMGDPARGELSKREMDKLKEVSERYRQISNR